MYVKHLKLYRFRNYEQCHLDFEPGIHLFIGNNAQGKTNLLEAIYVLALAKSHRTSKDRQLIRWQEDDALLQATVVKRHTTLPLQLHISAKGKKAKVNHLEQSRLSDYIGGLNVVMFAPEDLALVKGSPHGRRKFLDMEISQVHTAHLYHLTQYYKLLSQRNALLKNAFGQTDQLSMVEVFTEQLIEVAVKLIRRRLLFVRQLQKWAAPIHEQITQGKEKLKIRYKYSTGLKEDMLEIEMKESLRRQYEQMAAQERKRGTTLVGPHRDDLAFSVNDRDVQTYGSQGQQRTTALSLKLAEIELIREQMKEYPVLLLDDVLSELDDQRRSHLLAAMQEKVQTFVTDTSLEGIDAKTLHNAMLYDVHDGHITSR